MNRYQLLDCGDQKKVEILGKYKVIRPCPQALWKPFDKSLWNNVDVEFLRENNEKGNWKPLSKNKLPQSWEINSGHDLTWKIEPNEFGNIGIFTEHWTYTQELIETLDPNGKILNLFSYAGSSSMALMKNGFKVTSVDSSKNAMDTYTTNMDLNNISRDGQRIILEDAYKFIAREVRREAKYSSIIMDAPSYGRGTKGEVFKIEDDLVKLLETCKELITPEGKIITTLHSPRFTPKILEILCQQIFPEKVVSVSEIIQKCQSGAELPSGFIVKVL